MKKKRSKYLLVTGIILILITALYASFILVPVFFTPQKPEGIGIIGGADSPTAIFVFSQFKWFFIAPILTFSCGVGCIAAYLIINRK